MPLRAVGFWRAAIHLDSTDVDSRFNIAFTLQYDLGDVESALRHWMAASAMAPEDAGIILHGTQALLDLGRTTDAVSWLRRFVDQHPQHPRRQELEAALDTLRLAAG